MTLTEQKKLAFHFMRLLKVRQVSFPIANTEKGPLSIKFTKDQENSELVLDAVPLAMEGLDNENNREVKRIVEKYLFEDEEDEQHVEKAN